MRCTPIIVAMILGSAACRDRHPAPPTIAPHPVAPIRFDATAPLRVEYLGSPIRSTRTWTRALAPNARGGWNFITQVYELGAEAPPEFVVVDLQTGKSTVTPGTPRIYTQHRYVVENQLRAPNGRIFFPEAEVRMAYYDPADETVHELGPILDPRGANNIIFTGVFGPNGKLYLGTHSDGLPTIIELDPETLQTRRIGEVGQRRNGASYAYYMAVDPPWIYVAVGQSPWELAAIHLKTGESRILATVTDKPWMELENAGDGVVAKLVTGLNTPQQTATLHRVKQGKMIPLTARVPGLLHKSTAAGRAAPELDLSAVNPDSDGVGKVRWREPGDAWHETTFRVSHTSPIDLEFLSPLADGSVLGSAKQYHGFFRYVPSERWLQVYGQHGPSQPVAAPTTTSLFFAGYPNGVLYRFDVDKPWSAVGMDEKHDPNANPQWIGNYTASGAKYAVGLVASSNRIYFVGRRERDGVGAAVGYYDAGDGRFAGHAQNLSTIDPLGIAAVEKLQRIVVSGRLQAADGSSPQAELVVFDRDLNEVGRVVVKPGIRSTGRVFSVPGSAVILGVVPEELAVYRFDLATNRLLSWRQLPGSALGSPVQRADGSVWLMIDGALTQIDAQTSDVTSLPVAEGLPQDAEHLVWQGDDLYFHVKHELRRATGVGVR